MRKENLENLTLKGLSKVKVTGEGNRLLRLMRWNWGQTLLKATKDRKLVESHDRPRLERISKKIYGRETEKGHVFRYCKFLKELLPANESTSSTTREEKKNMA